MAKNQSVTAATQIGIVNGNTEGYSTQADVVPELLAVGDAGMLPATDPTSGGAASDTQTVLDNLDAKVNSAVAADLDKVADAFASGDGTISNAGTADQLSLSMVPTAVATVLAGSPAAMQTLINAFAAQPKSVRTALAAALLSDDADNSAVLGSDGLIYENDAVV